MGGIDHDQQLKSLNFLLDIQVVWKACDETYIH